MEITNMKKHCEIGSDEQANTGEPLLLHENYDHNINHIKETQTKQSWRIFTRHQQSKTRERTNL